MPTMQRQEIIDWWRKYGYTHESMDLRALERLRATAGMGCAFSGGAVGCYRPLGTGKDKEYLEMGAKPSTLVNLQLNENGNGTNR